MAVAAKTEEMMESVREVMTPNRFGTPDLHDKGRWMTKRIQEKYGHLNDQFIFNWLGGLTSRNEFYFVHTKTAVLLAERFIEALNPLPSVRVWFVLLADPKDKFQQEEGADICAAMAEWAERQGAIRIIDLDRLCDVPRPMLQEALGSRLYAEETLYVRLKK